MSPNSPSHSLTQSFTHFTRLTMKEKTTTNIPLWTDRIKCLQNIPIHIVTLIIKDLFLLQLVSKTERISYIITSQTLWLKQLTKQLT